MDQYPFERKNNARIKAKRLKYLIISLCSNLGILFAFKYFNFFNDSLRAVFDGLNIFYGVPTFEILLPVGISFYTFQTLSYTIDVYYGKRAAEKNLGIFALYVSFFPQLVAGPIERSTHLMPQFFEKVNFNYERVSSGLKLMLWGFFKKIVIADYLAVYVDKVFNNPSEFYGISILLAAYFFAFQIYCDFSAYSDIAIGAAKVLGFDLMENFKKPYLAKSIPEFWNRWHISLSTWFRDYVYIPLGGSRVAKSRWYLNILAVFLVSGLWHGANWTFVLWGALHASYYLIHSGSTELRGKIYEALSLNKFPKLREFLKILLTFHLVVFAWIFFRANSVGDLGILLHNLFYLPEITSFKLAKISEFNLLFGLIPLIALIFMEWKQGTLAFHNYISLKPRFVRWMSYSFLIVVTLLFLQSESSDAFIYFQF